MTKSLRYSIIGAVVVLTALMIWFMGGEQPVDPVTKSKVKHISSDWSNPYNWSSKDPYGLFIFNDLVKERAPKDSLFSVRWGSQLDSLAGNVKTGTYLYVGQEFGLYNEEIDTLFSLVEKGSDLIVITGNVTDNFAESFNPRLEYVFDYSQKCRVRSSGKDYEMVYLFQNDTLAYPWKMIWHPESYPSTTKVHSTISGHANFISFSHGKGRILLHSTPECFLNFQLTRKEGFLYADKLIKEIDPKKKLYYLELGRLKEREAEELFDVREDENKKGKRDDSYLQFLFQSPALRTALLMALLGVVLFLIFRSKRMRPVVGVLPAKRNMSEIFVTTIASIYRNKENPYSVLQLHRKNFYNTIQKHFYIDLSKRTDHREIIQLSSRCGVEPSEIEQLLTRLENDDTASCNEEFLTDTAIQKRAFYVKSGIINDRITRRLDDREIILFRPIWLSLPYMLLGISLILWGLYLLVHSKGIGIVLWPLGTILIIWSILRLSRPVLKLQGDEISHFPYLRSRRVWKLHDLIRAEKQRNSYILHFRDADSIHILNNELGRNERQQLEAYLLRNNIIEF